MRMKKKIFAVSDVHGHCELLVSALNVAGFEKDNEEHLLVCCGDYFDRGNENMQVLRFFERLPHCVLLRGNHEDLLLKVLMTGKVLPHNYINGTLQTLADFFGKYCLDPVTDELDLSGQSRTVDRVCDFINGTVNYFETENYVFVHGWLPERAQTPEERAAASAEAWEKARWVRWTDRYDGTRPLPDKTLVCGHVPTFLAGRVDSTRSMDDSGIYYGNGLIAIDTGTFDTRRVNVLVIEDELVF